MKKINKITSFGLVVVMVAVLMLPFAQIANALALTSLSDTLSTVKASTLANHEIKFVTPASGGVAAGETITYTFSAGFVMGSQVLADWDFASGSTNNCSSATFTEKALLGTASGASWGAAIAGQVITITSGTDTIVADRCIRLKVGANATSESAGTIRITNPTASSPTVAIAGTFGDTGTITVNIIADDQVAVTATVAQSITFAITGDATMGFGTLTTANARFADTTTGTAGPTSASAHTLTIATNAPSGYSITYNGATLTSGGNTIAVATITGDEDGVPGSAQFAIGFTKSGDATIATAYNQVSPTFNYSFVAGTTTQIVSETVPTATETISAFYLANIAGSTAAGSYTTTLTYVAVANF